MPLFFFFDAGQSHIAARMQSSDSYAKPDFNIKVDLDSKLIFFLEEPFLWFWL